MVGITLGTMPWQPRICLGMIVDKGIISRKSSGEGGGHRAAGGGAALRIRSVIRSIQNIMSKGRGYSGPPHLGDRISKLDIGGTLYFQDIYCKLVKCNYY